MISKAKSLLLFLSPNAAFWLIIGVIGSLALTSIELAISGVLQLLFVKINLMPMESLPPFLRSFDVWSLKLLCIGLSLIGLGRAICQFTTSQAGNFFALIFETRLKVLTSYEFLKRDTQILSSSEVNFRFGQVFPRAGSFVAICTNFVVSFVQATLIFISLLYLSWKEAMVAIIGVAILGVVAKLLKSSIISLNAAVLAEQSEMNQSIQRISRNWLFIKISRLENKEYLNLVNRLLYCFNHVGRSGVFIRATGILPTLLGVVLIAFIIYISKSHFQTDGAILLSFLYLFMRFAQQLSATVDTLTNAMSYYPSFRISYDQFKSYTPDDLLQGQQHLSEMKIFKKFLGLPEYKEKYIAENVVRNPPQIIFDKVDFAWPGDSKHLFSHFSFNISPGETVGIMGPSGSGKSTLLLLILGILKPGQGKILVDNKLPQDYFHQKTFSTGYVGPDPFIINGSVRDNILYGYQGQVSDAAIKEALLRSELSSLSEKLDYKLTENGEGLSSGQKQRLALARALLKNPDFLVLDEATANLDIETEANLAETLEKFKKKMTIIIVSHRKGILKYADKVMDMESVTKA
jgi:ABC-type multidrug transport system fused ATPase/permease subunit